MGVQAAVSTWVTVPSACNLAVYYVPEKDYCSFGPLHSLLNMALLQQELTDKLVEI